MKKDDLLNELKQKFIELKKIEEQKYLSKEIRNENFSNEISSKRINYRTKRDEYEHSYSKAIIMLLQSKELNFIKIPLIYLVQQFIEISIKDMCYKAHNNSISKVDKTFIELKLNTHDIKKILKENRDKLIELTSEQCFIDITNALNNFYKLLNIETILSNKYAEVFRFPTPLENFEPYLNYDLDEIDTDELFFSIKNLLLTIMKADILCTKKYNLDILFSVTNNT